MNLETNLIMTEQEKDYWQKRTVDATTECNRLTLECKTTKQVANRLGMSAKALYKELEERGVLFKDSGIWMLEPEYIGLGLLLYRYSRYLSLDGEFMVRTYPVWTQQGVEFIEDMLLSPTE